MGRGAVQSALKHVIGLDFSVPVDIAIVNLPFGVAEVGSVGEADGWGEHVPHCPDGPFAEAYHAIQFSGDVAREVEVDEVVEAP